MYRIDMTKRVGESSKRSSRTRTPRSSLSIPPSSTPRSSQKRGPARKDKKRKNTPKVENTDDFYEIKRIVDQEDRDGEIWYLVDWEDHKITGESYPHEWASITCFFSAFQLLTWISRCTILESLFQQSQSGRTIRRKIAVPPARIAFPFPTSSNLLRTANR